VDFSSYDATADLALLVECARQFVDWESADHYAANRTIILPFALNAGCDSQAFLVLTSGRHKGTLFLGPGVARIGSNYLLLVAQPPLPLQVFLPLHP
jgi:hypothetical protein